MQDISKEVIDILKLGYTITWKTFYAPIQDAIIIGELLEKMGIEYSASFVNGEPVLIEIKDIL